MVEIRIPKVGMGITEVEISSWQVKIGDKVEPGTPIVEIEMEKASTIIESKHSGVVKEILYKVGEIVSVGSVVCRIEES